MTDYTNEKIKDTLSVSIVAAQHGGLAIYESNDADMPLVFSGDLDQFEKYIRGRAAQILANVAEARKAEQDEITKASVKPQTTHIRDALRNTTIPIRSREEPIEAAE